MERIVVLGVVINFMVSFLLFVSMDRLSLSNCLRAAAAAALGSLCAGACMLPSFSFLQERTWQIVSMLAGCLIAFGLHRSTFRKSAVYCLLRLALEGLASGNGVADLLWAVVLALVYRKVFAPVGKWKQYLPVELNKNGQSICCHALMDTGNSLRDPVTGKPVLVVDAQVAGRLTGLTPQQLAAPLQTMGTISGLRLIPFRSVGGTGFMLARQFPQVRIGQWEGAVLVAFSSQVLDPEGKYQALIGGEYVCSM